jgi:hypothetical protein
MTSWSRPLTRRLPGGAPDDPAHRARAAPRPVPGRPSCTRPCPTSAAASTCRASARSRPCCRGARCGAPGGPHGLLAGRPAGHGDRIEEPAKRAALRRAQAGGDLPRDSGSWRETSVKLRGKVNAARLGAPARDQERAPGEGRRRQAPRQGHRADGRARGRDPAHRRVVPASVCAAAQRFMPSRGPQMISPGCAQARRRGVGGLVGVHRRRRRAMPPGSPARRSFSCCSVRGRAGAGAAGWVRLPDEQRPTAVRAVDLPLVTPKPPQAVVPPVAAPAIVDPGGAVRGTMIMVHAGGWAGHDEHAPDLLSSAPGSSSSRSAGASCRWTARRARRGCRMSSATAGSELARRTSSRPVCIYGESAGGHLALLAVFAPARDRRRRRARCSDGI